MALWRRILTATEGAAAAEKARLLLFQRRTDNAVDGGTQKAGLEARDQ
jgi:hypothetical protein